MRKELLPDSPDAAPAQTGNIHKLNHGRNILPDWLNSESLASLGSGTATTPPTDQSCKTDNFPPARFFVSALNSVDLPTFGNPTMPMDRDINLDYR